MSTTRRSARRRPGAVVGAVAALTTLTIGVTVAPVLPATASEARARPGVSRGYVTYLGGGENDGATAVAVDDAGATYLAGYRTSDDFPTTDGSTAGGAFVAKIAPGGRRLVFSRLVGGLRFVSGIAVDDRGAVYLTGTGGSTSYRPPGPALCPPEDADPEGDAVVVKLSPAGDRVDYATCLGGSDTEYAGDIAVDATGAAYVTGSTRSADFPVRGAVQPAFGGGSVYGDAYVAKLDPAGAVGWATYLGGSAGDTATGIAVGQDGSAFVTGNTYSSDFPSNSALQPRHAEGRENVQSTDAFVTKFDPTGARLDYSTYLGGGRTDEATGIAVDDRGAAHVTGYTDSVDFPVRRAVQPVNHGHTAFVSKIDPDGLALAYSTYLGGNAHGQDIALDSAGAAYVVGAARTGELPIDVPAGRGQPHFEGRRDAFVTRFTTDGRAVTYSTFLGGSGDDRPAGIAVDPRGNVYLAGETGSQDLPTHRAVQPRYGGGRVPLPSDAFVARLVVPDWDRVRRAQRCNTTPTIIGTNRADVIHGARDGDVILAREGDDRVTAGGGKDYVCAGQGNDTVRGSRGADWLEGGPGADRLDGGRGNDHLMGRTGADRLHGGPGRDVVWGHQGRDRLDGGRGRDSCQQGSGDQPAYHC